MSTKTAAKKAVKKAAVKKAVKKAAAKKAVKKAAAKKAPSVFPVKLNLVQEGGVKCVQRDNGQLATGVKCRKGDIVRVQNVGQKGKIKVIVDPAAAAKLFSPVPDAKVTLAPGETMDWKIRWPFPGTQSLRYKTDPSDCTGNDQNDIIINC